MNPNLQPSLTDVMVVPQAEKLAPGLTLTHSRMASFKRSPPSSVRCNDLCIRPIAVGCQTHSDVTTRPLV